MLQGLSSKALLKAECSKLSAYGYKRKTQGNADCWGAAQGKKDHGFIIKVSAPEVATAIGRTRGFSEASETFFDSKTSGLSKQVPNVRRGLSHRR